MTLGRIYLQASKSRQCFFDGVELAPAQIEFNCGSCHAIIEKDLWSFLATTIDLPDYFDQDQIDSVEKNFNLQKAFINYKTCDGLHAHFGLIKCAACDQNHFVCVGFSEVQPARYKASLQVVCEIV